MSELGKQLATKWFTLVVFPGALWLAALLIGIQLRGTRTFNATVIMSLTSSVTAKRAEDSLGARPVAIAGILAGSAFAGLIAVALGSIVRKAWISDGYGPSAKLFTCLRQKRWDRAETAINNAAVTITSLVNSPESSPKLIRHEQHKMAAALRTIESYGSNRPAGPTWVSDHWRSLIANLEVAYGVKLAVIWPRLWVLLPESLRLDLALAQDSFAAAGNMLGWALMYLAIGVIWSPMLLVAIGIALTASSKARASTRVLCDLTETAVDLYGRDLAERLQIRCDGPLTVEVGRLVTTRLAKRIIAFDKHSSD